MRRSVDFPHPEGPISETNSPRSTASETSRSASVSPAWLGYVLPTRSSVMIATREPYPTSRKAPAVTRPGPGGRASLDHPVRTSQDELRDRHAERGGCSQVDDQLHRRRQLDREVARLGALEDPVHVGRQPSK